MRDYCDGDVNATVTMILKVRVVTAEKGKINPQ